MAHREVMEDGTIRIDGQIVPQGGSIPTIASVVSYSGNTNLQSTNVEAALDELDNEKAPIGHLHDDRYFTEVEVTNLLAGKSDTNHNHDSRYFTEAEVTAALALKSDTGHLHDDRYYTEAETNEKIALALGTVEAHDNPSFDIVTMSTDGPGGQVVTARLYPSGWGNFWQTGSGADSPILTADPDVTKNGSGFSFKMQLPTANSGQTLNSSVFAVSPGAIVTVEAWVKGTAAGPAAFMTILTNVNTDPDFYVPGNASVDSAITVPGTDWERRTLTFTVPATHNRCRFMLRSVTSGWSSNPGTLWWDETKSKVQVFPNPVTNSHLGAINRLGQNSSTSGMTDYNTVLDSGYYVMDSAAANRPSFNATCYLEVRAYSTTYIEQVARHVISGLKATRRMTGGTWGAWVEDVDSLLITGKTGWNNGGTRLHRRGNVVQLSINCTPTQNQVGGAGVFDIPPEHRPVSGPNHYYFAVADSASGGLTLAFITGPSGGTFAHTFARNSGQGTLGFTTYLSTGN